MKLLSMQSILKQMALLYLKLMVGQEFQELYLLVPMGHYPQPHHHQ
ncbi:hypothetical protein ZOSMA_29G01500 [Zostera marina]|uniref:Uncharacterized protein n=1 Tax=Zostera marina TaxID=29655 RepID=A0A0K9PE13_ZOSMR|nr:hypothetical protein ZOSMA_29G01500 [Zostera marina]